jgi:RNA polymerase sigma-70 factor (ECF subfamily)
MALRGREPRDGLTADEFSARFQQGARVLWTLAASLVGDPAEAEDVCQEAFLAAFEKRERFEPGTNWLAWMGCFVRNVAKNEARKRARRRTVRTDPTVLDAHPLPERPAQREPASLDAPEGLIDPESFDERLLSGLRELGEVPRACLILRAVSELGYAEIAALLGIPEGTAMSHVHRARIALRARLETHDGVRP